MAFKRIVAPETPLFGDAATAAYIAIGMRLTGEPSVLEPNIEDTLWGASREGMDGRDLRLLSILTDWLAVHGERINVDRLTRLLQMETSVRVRAFWTAIAQWRLKDDRFARLRRLYVGPPLELLPVGTAFSISRRGEDPRFAGSVLRVPQGTLRERPRDVVPPTQLAQRHRSYRCRVLMGPSYRADMWALMESWPTLSNAEVARRAYGSHVTAREVRRDLKTLMESPTSQE